ncbi:MAG: AMP-binding protein [Marinicella sp.]|nr:acyl-CoA synthetase [Xanthomonadales bacterium]
MDILSALPAEHVLMASDKCQVTVAQMYEYVASVQQQLMDSNVRSCALFSEDKMMYIAVFLACISADIDIVLPANNLPELAKKISVDCLIGDWGTQAKPIDLSVKDSTVGQMNTDSNSKITLFTSGSTGEPKSITRSLSQLLAEIEVLDDTFAGNWQKCLFASTVSHQHIYGLLFSILWPICKGHTVWYKLLPFEEMIDDINQLQLPWVLVSSPAFLKRLNEDHSSNSSPIQVFSSGGVLTDAQHFRAEKKLAAFITQVYGSSETGGIAHRGLQQDWLYFMGVESKIEAKQLWVRSAFCYRDDWLCTQDLIEVTDKGFKLLGRNDRIVKIEEKRISLNMIEQQAIKLEWVVDAAALVIEEGRQYIATVFEINQTGLDFINQYGEVELKKAIKNVLSQTIDRIALPRKIRFSTDPLVNSQGKKIQAELVKLFT